jgi:hypothetical protein
MKRLGQSSQPSRFMSTRPNLITATAYLFVSRRRDRWSSCYLSDHRCKRIGPDSRTPARSRTETDASVPAQIVIQLGSGCKSAGSIAKKQPIELGRVLAGKGARPNGDFRLDREGRSLPSRRVRDQQAGADDVYGLYRQLGLTLRYDVLGRQQDTRAPAWSS